MSLEEYESVLSSSKVAQKQQLEIVTLMERRNNVLRNTFILPAKYRASFNSLPDEVLLKIVKCCPPLEQPRFALLNRRSRDFVYASPSLWSYVSLPSMSAAEIRRHIFMSQPLQLHVDAQIAQWSVGLIEKAQLCIGLSPRWHSIRYDAVGLQDFGIRPVLAPVSDLSSVRVVELPGYECIDAAILDDVVERERANMTAFTNVWNFPGLSKLILRENVPPQGSFTSIGTLHVRMEFPSLSDEARFRPFVEALPGLQHLDVEVDFSGPEIYEWDFIWSGDELQLHHLLSFSFSVKRRARDGLDETDTEAEQELDADVCNFVSSISMPNVEKVSLSLFEGGPGPTTIFASVEELFPVERSLTKVTDFRLKINPVLRRSDVYLSQVERFIISINERLPSLSTFTVHLPSEAFEDANFVGLSLRHEPPSSDLLRLLTNVTAYAKFTWPEDDTLSGSVDGEMSFERAQYGMSCLSLQAIRLTMPDVSFSLCPL